MFLAAGDHLHTHESVTPLAVGGVRIWSLAIVWFVCAAGSCGSSQSSMGPAIVSTGQPEVPTVANADGDDLLDDADQCPDERETYNGLNDEDGCPERGSSSGEPRPLANERVVTGPGRPDACPIFRRLKSPAGQLELKVVSFPPEATETQLFTDLLDELVAISGSIKANVILCATGGQRDVERSDLGPRRVAFVAAALEARGLTATRMVVGTGSQCEPRSKPQPEHGEVWFQLTDRSEVTTSYRCGTAK